MIRKVPPEKRPGPPGSSNISKCQLQTTAEIIQMNTPRLKVGESVKEKIGMQQHTSVEGQYRAFLRIVLLRTLVTEAIKKML